MDALRYDLSHKELALHKIPIPRITEPDQVILEVAYSGICGTDLHILDGEYRVRPTTVTLGHEFSGIITEVGSTVRNLKKGDHVAVDPNTGCDCCQHCTTGRYNLCEDFRLHGTIGSLEDGGFARYCKVSARQVFKLPPNLPLEHGALTEPISCLCHGMRQLGPVSMGSRILVIGAGIIGLLWVNALHLKGHRNIVVSESSDSRRKLAQALGLGIEVVTPDELLSRHMKNGFKVIVECSGNAKATEAAMDVLAAGGTMLIFGLTLPSAKMTFSPYTFLLKEQSIIGVLTNPYTMQESIGYLEILNDKYLDFNKMGIQIFRLDQYQEAFKAIRERKISKAVFKIK